MKEEFVGKAIKVIYDFEHLQPTSFIWENKEYKIAEIIDSYQDFGFSAAAPKKKNWRIRKHRNYWIVKTSGRVKFKIYLDRASGQRNWFIFSKYG